MTPDPTPQHDHGAAGFCTDHTQAAPDEFSIQRKEERADVRRMEKQAREKGGQRAVSRARVLWIADYPETPWRDVDVISAHYYLTLALREEGR